METNKMSNLNRIFTRNMLCHFIDGKTDNVYSSVVRRYTSNADQKNNRELISEIYCELKNNYQNEYFYKNTLLNKLLLGVHSVNTTTALTEVAIAKSKADFVLINGKAVVYEIKTELDNLERLSSQIDDYYKAFDHVAVVTYEKNLQQLQRVLDIIDKPVGVYVLRKNGKLGTYGEKGKQLAIITNLKVGSFNSNAKEEKNQKLKESLSASLKENNNIIYMNLLRANSKPERFIERHADNRGTIHIVYFDIDESLRVKHFVSDLNDDISDPAGKFQEALSKLVEWNEEKQLDTVAMKEFEDLYRREAYPGLGTVKKLSIMHHLELIGRYLDKE